MYTAQINKILLAMRADRVDIVQLLLSNLLLDDSGQINERAKRELTSALPGSRVVFGGANLGFRAGYLEFGGERFYFA